MSINKSIFITLGTSLPNIILSFISGIFITRIMGAEGKGVFSMYQNNAILFFTFFSLSITSCFNVFLNNKSLSPAKIIGISIYIFGLSTILLGGLIFFLIQTDYIYLFFPKNYFDKSYLIFFFLYYLSYFAISLLSTILTAFKEFFYESISKLINAFLILIFFVILFFYKNDPQLPTQKDNLISQKTTFKNVNNFKEYIPEFIEKDYSLPSLSILIQKGTNPICLGESITFLAKTNAKNPQYSWFVNNANIKNNNTSFSTRNLNNGDLIYSEITFNDDQNITRKLKSNVIKIEVLKHDPSVSILIEKGINPTCLGNSVILKAKSVYGGNNPKFVWYSNNQKLSEASNQLQLSNIAENQNIYCELISNEKCVTYNKVKSNEISITVATNLMPSISIEFANNEVSVCKQNEIEFVAKPVLGGTNPYIIWKVNGTVFGKNSLNFKKGGFIDGDKITCEIISNDACANPIVVSSNEIIIKNETILNPKIEIINEFGSNTICNNQSINFSLKTHLSGTNPDFTWKINNKNVGKGKSLSYFNFKNGDVLTCEMKTNDICANTNIVSSNPLKFEVKPSIKPNIYIQKKEIENTDSIVLQAITFNSGRNPVYIWKENGNQMIQNSNSIVIAAKDEKKLYNCDLIATESCVYPRIAKSNLIAIDPIQIPLVNIKIVQINNKFLAKVENCKSKPIYNWFVNGKIQDSVSELFENDNLKNNDNVKCEIKIGDLVYESNEIKVLINNTLTNKKENKISNIKTNTDSKTIIIYILYYHLFFQLLLLFSLLFVYLKKIKIIPDFKINYRKDILPIQKYLMYIHLAVFVSFLNYKFDLWVIQYFGSDNSYETTKQIGYYTQASNITNLLWIIPAQLRVVVLVYVINEPLENKLKIISLYSRINFTLILLASLALILISYIFVTKVYGIEFAPTVFPLQILAIGGVFLCHIKFISLIFEVFNQPEKLIISTIIGIILTFVLDYFLIPTYGIIGASIASSISYIGTSVYLIYNIKKISNFPFLDFFLLKKSDIHSLKTFIKSKIKPIKEKKL